MKIIKKILLLSLLLGFSAACSTSGVKVQKREFSYYSPSSSTILSEVDISEQEPFELSPKAIRFMSAECRKGTEQTRAVECQRASLD